MPAQLKEQLTDLITNNDLEDFFSEWKEAIDPSSVLNRSCLQLKAEYYELEDNIISRLLRSEEAGLRKRQLVNSLLLLTDKIGADDLKHPQQPAAKATPTAPTTEDPLKALIRRKLAALQRAHILAVDAAQKFKLEVEIEELKKQMK